MRKLILLFVVFIMTTTLMAEGHMKFKGIEITGTPNSFVQQMKAKGFVSLMKQDDVEIMQGDFAGHKDCMVLIVPTKGQVVKVVVIIGRRDNWNSLYGDYTSLKSMLTTKYGDPTIDVEEWQGYGQPEDDNSRMHELRMDRGKFMSNFETENGSVELVITRLDYSACSVTLEYYDKQSQEELMNQAIEDL